MSDPHAPVLQELAARNDWAGLARYGMANQHPKALDQAIAVVRNLDHWNNQKRNTVLTFLEQVRANPIDLERQVTSQEDFDGLSAELATLQLLPIKSALRRLIMENQAIGNIPFPAFAQELIERGKVEGLLEGKRETLFRLMERVRIPLSETDRTQIENCSDTLMLNLWIDNGLGAKTAGEVLR